MFEFYAENVPLGAFEVADHENRGYFDPPGTSGSEIFIFCYNLFVVKNRTKNWIFGFIFSYFVLGSVFCCGLVA